VPVVGGVGGGMSKDDEIESSVAEKAVPPEKVKVSLAVVEDLVGDNIGDGDKIQESISIAKTTTDIAQTTNNAVFGAAIDGVVQEEIAHDMDDDKTVDLDGEKMRTVADSYSSGEKSESDAVEEQAPMEEVLFNSAVQVESPIQSSDDDENLSPKDAIAVADAPERTTGPSITPSSKTSDMAKPKNKSAAKSSPDKTTPAKGKTSIVDSLKISAACPKKSHQTPESTNKQALPISAESTRSISDKATLETSNITTASKTGSSIAVATAPKPTKSSSSKNAKKFRVTDGSISMEDTSEPKPASKSVSCKATATKATELPTEPLSDENSARMKKYLTLREQYVIRAVEVASRSAADDFEEERLSDTDLPLLEEASVEIGDDGGFPDELLPHLLILVQGR
jgi:hypothetical protein